MNLLLLSNALPQGFEVIFDNIFEYSEYMLAGNQLSPKTDVIYFGGGTDVSPSFYHEPIGKYTNIPDSRRDLAERNIWSLAQGQVRGFLGICRGSQFLTVMNGARLIQHVGHEHCRDHQIQTVTGQIMNVTSTHHQMMYPFDLPKQDYQLLAWPYPENLSAVYLNGHNQPYDKSLIQKEPEIVWYPKTKSLCIQGHPEYLPPTHPYPAYCHFLIKNFLLS